MEAFDLKSFEELATKVDEQHTDFRAAVDEELEASVRLLEAVVKTVKPALPALATRPLIGSRTWWPDSVSPSTKTDRATWRAVCLDDDKPGPSEDYPRATAGSYEGSDLFLRVDGTLARLDYEGSWSRWQGSTDQWTAEETVLSPCEALGRYGAGALEEWIGRIAKACEAQLGGSKPIRTKAARERAAKLSAIVKLAR
ncbi:MAG: hypothetical protein HYV07_09655 [Deltaproteobacteria bacterium]|nr:hypothetical protein [Deltaproteobacteria bacterium]